MKTIEDRRAIERLRLLVEANRKPPRQESEPERIVRMLRETAEPRTT